jgi:hypothetical protein
MLRVVYSFSSEGKGEDKGIKYKKERKKMKIQDN